MATNTTAATVTITVRSKIGRSRRFIACCGDGDLEGARALLQSSSGELTKPQAIKALKSACAGGHLPVIQLLVKFSERADWRFSRAIIWHVLKRACSLGFLPIAQWVTVHFDVTAPEARIHENMLFRLACMYGHADVATWIAREFDLTGREADEVADVVVEEAARYGTFSVVQGVYAEEFGISLLPVARAAPALAPCSSDPEVSARADAWVDAQEMAQQHPDTFGAPGADGILGLEPGRSVKICNGQERVWVTLVHASECAGAGAAFGRVFRGTIDSALHEDAGYGYGLGSLVEFEGRHVYTYR